MNYTIEGAPLPVVICNLEGGETMLTEKGALPAASLAEKESLIPSSPDRDVYGCRACRLHSSPELSARLFQIKI